jgi:D-alanyl-D-alanine carboxypeptidase (penicillin-binding protein 5/6)
MGRSITAALSGSIAALSVVASRVLGTSTIASSGQPAITSALGCVIDSTGAVLFNKAKDTQHGQASTTKMMTAYVACQHAATSDVATMPADLATGGSESYPGESNAGLVTGERLTCAQLLTAMLYPSGGDAARMLAACVGGLYLGGTDQDLSGQAAFVAEMNAQAAALGMTNTHYVNPSGNAQYPGGTTVITTHYSSTYDMCLLVRAAMTQSGAMADALRAAHLLGGANVTTSVTTRHYDNLAAAIGIGNYPGCTGSKGGSWGPTPSIHAHLGSATRGSHTVYFAVMDTNNATGPDVPIMLDYAFSQLNENASATATVQDGNTLITGGWGRSGSFPLNYSEAYAAISTAANATLTVTLTGYAFRVFMPKSTNRGIVAVYFDNVFQTNVDLYNAGGFQTAASIGPIWSTTLTSRGAHTIKLVNTGTKNASSTGTTLDLDYITYDDQLGPLSLPITAGMPSFLTLTSGTTGTVPFTVGQVFEQGAVTTGNYATLTNSSSYQIKPTNHWADGSVKHAIISGLTATTAATPKAHGFSTTTTFRRDSLSPKRRSPSPDTPRQRSTPPQRRGRPSLAAR